MATPTPHAGYPICAARYAGTAWGGQAAGHLISPSFTPPAGRLLVVFGWASENANLSLSGGGLTWTQKAITGTYPREYVWEAVAPSSPPAMQLTLSSDYNPTHLGIAIYAADDADTAGLGAIFATTGYAPGSSPYQVAAPGGVAADSLLLGGLALTNLSNLGAFSAMSGCVEDFGTGNRDEQGVETASPWPRRWSVGRITTGSAYGGTVSGNVPFRMGGIVVEVRAAPLSLSLSPTHVSPNGGATVTFTANGWLGATATVTVDGASVSATVVDANHGTFVAPLHASGEVTVSVTSNGITRTATLWYDAVVPPADTDYAAYFLSSLSAVVLLETLEISHPEFSQTYWVVRNKTDGLRALLETGAPQDFDYHPLRIRSQSARDNLDAGLEVDLGDLGEIVPAEIDRLLAAGSTEPPTVRYRAYRSDDLTRPLYGPIRYEMGPITMAKEGASFEAKAPSLNISRTGSTYSLAVFPMLRGCI